MKMTKRVPFLAIYSQCVPIMCNGYLFKIKGLRKEYLFFVYIYGIQTDTGLYLKAEPPRIKL